MLRDTTMNLLRHYLRHTPATPGAPRLAELLDHHYSTHSKTTVTRTRHGIRHPVNTHDIIQRYLYLFGIWEPAITNWITSRLQPGDTFIDVGAHTGYYTLLASRLVGPTGHVVAIEPVPAFHQTLLDTADANGCTNIRAINTAASNTTGRLTLYTPDTSNLGNTTIIKPCTPTTGFTVNTAPLPAILTTGELTGARIIKIDVEGAEAAVLQGLQPALHLLRPDAELIIEITPRSLAKLGATPTDITEPLAEHGFAPYTIPNDYAPGSYPRQLTQPSPPMPYHPGTAMADVIFTRGLP